MSESSGSILQGFVDGNLRAASKRRRTSAYMCDSLANLKSEALQTKEGKEKLNRNLKSLGVKPLVITRNKAWDTW
eukprot:COSAG01_NODE_1015_length_12114_cov_214.545651_7_plen_75_part_00